MRALGLAFLLGVMATAPVMAERIPSHCVALAGQYPGVHYAALVVFLIISDQEVRLHYIGHSTYLLETEGGTKVATDFTGFVGIDILPDVVTMNRAHSSHYTDYPDPAIPHVLKGWGDGSGPAEHYLELDEIIVRNVTTDIRAGIDARVKDGQFDFLSLRLVDFALDIWGIFITSPRTSIMRFWGGWMW